MPYIPDLTDWMIAFHGTEFQSLNSVFVNQGLREHYDAGIARHMIFCHGTTLTAAESMQKDWVRKISSGTAKKAETYCHHTDVFGDGCFWTIKFELMVDRGQAWRQKTAGKCRKDQCWQTADNCVIKALCNL